MIVTKPVRSCGPFGSGRKPGLTPRPVAATVCAVLVSLLVLATGCGGGGEKITEIELRGMAMQDSFALYFPAASSTTPRVPAYTVSLTLSGVGGASAAALPPGAVRALGTQGFVAIAGGGGNIYDIYESAQWPKFVTIDAVMSAFDGLCTNALATIENAYLAGDLEELVLALYATVHGMYEGSEGTVRQASLADLAYLGVAARLMGLEVDVPPEAEGMVGEELALIAGRAGPSPSPIFGYAHDYSRHTPRGHYRTDSGLEEYYQAMTWLSGMGFYPSPSSSPGGITAGRDMTRQALLLVGALHMAEAGGETALTAWDRIFQSTSFLDARAAELDAYTYSSLARELYGESFPLSRLADDALIDAFIARALEERSPRISSLSGDEVEVAASQAAFRLFGLPHYPEDVIFERTLAPEVEDRYMPRGLDVPTAMGSYRGLEILDQFYGEKSFEGYAESMDGLRKLFKSVDPTQKHSDLYWIRLDVLGRQLVSYGEGYPTFMRMPAWQDRGLYSFLGAWTDARHEAPAVPAPVDTGQPQPQATEEAGYVEPCPEAFASLAAGVDMLRRGLQERGLSTAPLRERLDAMYGLATGLKTMAEKELRAEALSAGENAVIAGIGATLRYLATMPGGGEGEAASGTAASLPQVETVHVDANYGEALQVAVAGPVAYYVVAPVGGVPTLTVGAGYSYYEFVKPADGTLSDEAWRAAVEAGQLPERPAWSASFLQ
ncbi:MAG: DUF3160 domain-containing protein [Actinomycetota bacterium]